MQPDVQIVVVNGASRSSFGGAPGCGWPGGIPVAVYLAAATRDARELRLIEPRLRCEDDPAFFVEPTPWASIDACVHGLWTGSAEHAIRRAELTPQIKGLDPAKLFPADPGAMRCRIAAGGPLFAHRPRSFQGLCGVNLTGSASNKLVHFVETWTVGGHVFRHRWTIRGSTLVAQHGPAPPQRWS
jgi:hypothetical protein